MKSDGGKIMAKKKTTKRKKSPVKKKATKAKKSTKTEKVTTAKESKEKTKSKKRSKSKPEKKTEPVIKEIITVGADLEEMNDSDDEAVLINTGKWWLEEPWRSLLDPDLASNVNLAKFDISSLIEQFIDKMLKEELIDFRISGLAIYSSAKFYHKKITSVIAEEEQIQREEYRERLRREIPKAISQPLRESRKIATSNELFSAMRRAIIETMQKREKLRLRRERIVSKREKQVKLRGKGRLPAEILKHITGSELTIEERLQKTHQKIKEIIRMENEDQTFSLDLMKNMIYSDDSPLLKKKVKYIQLFEELLFLTSLSKLRMQQETLRSSMEITLIDKRKFNLS